MCMGIGGRRERDVQQADPHQLEHACRNFQYIPELQYPILRKYKFVFPQDICRCSNNKLTDPTY